MVDLETFAGLKIVKAKDLNVWGMCIAIYGPGGVGKTTFAMGAADSEYGGKVVFLDAEGGARSISHRSDVDVIEIWEWKQLQAFNNELTRADTIPWGTIVLDNMSEYQAVSMKHILGGGDLPQIQHWNKSTNDMLVLTRFYRDLARKRGINVILIAWDAPEKDESGSVTKRDVGFTPSLARQFPGIVDIVGYLTVENNPPLWTRHLSFAPSPKTAAKFRRSRNENAMKIPLEIFYGENDNPMADLLATLKGGKPWPTNRYNKPVRS